MVLEAIQRQYHLLKRAVDGDGDGDGDSDVAGPLGIGTTVGKGWGMDGFRVVEMVEMEMVMVMVMAMAIVMVLMTSSIPTVFPYLW